MNRPYTARVLLSIVMLIASFGCVTLTKAIAEQQPAVTATPDEDATVAAVMTDIGISPSSVAWMATVNAVSTQGFYGNPADLDGAWTGTGFTVDNTDYTLDVEIANNYITDITINYPGSGNEPCSLHISGTEKEYGVDFLPAEIDFTGTVYLEEFGGFTGTFFPDNSASGGMGLKITDQSKAACNVELIGAWTAEKK